MLPQVIPLCLFLLFSLPRPLLDVEIVAGRQTGATGAIGVAIKAVVVILRVMAGAAVTKVAIEALANALFEATIKITIVITVGTTDGAVTRVAE